jgi:hypothetical protein
MKKTIEKDSIKIELELNSDATVNLNRMMHVQYADDSGEIVEFDAYPDVVEGKKYGTIQAQFDYIGAIIRFDTAYAKATLKQIKQFFKERPNLSVSGISQEAGFSSRYLSFILEGDKPVTKNVVEKLQPVLLRYGFGRK